MAAASVSAGRLILVPALITLVVTLLLSIFGGWDTHYAKPRPDFPAMGPGGIFFWTALLPQLSVWIYLTIVGGMLFAALAFALRRAATREEGTSLPTSPA
jgi:hypothetical protein